MVHSSRLSTMARNMLQHNFIESGPTQPAWWAFEGSGFAADPADALIKTSPFVRRILSPVGDRS